MRFNSSCVITSALAVIMSVACIQAKAAETYGLGRPAAPNEIAAWNIDVRSDGQGLPLGEGSVADGRKTYADACAACHGEKGQGGAAPALAGGIGTLTTAKPVKTVGSYWPYATTLFDYVRRAMPFNAPQSLSNDELYAVSAYVLYLNGILPETASLNADNLARVLMPNRDGFFSVDAKVGRNLSHPAQTER